MMTCPFRQSQEPAGSNSDPASSDIVGPKTGVSGMA